MVVHLLGTQNTVADVGCDHGRLSAALLQRGICKKIIASDVSAASLEKARDLRRITGLQADMDLRVGDGLHAFSNGEADAVVIAGMGGTLMCKLLQDCTQPLNGAKLAVLQPMRAHEDIRKWLFERGYPIIKDRIVEDAGRLYQVFSVLPPAPDQKPVLPDGWPKDFFELGYTALQQQEPLFLDLANRMLDEHQKRLKTANGRGAAILKYKVDALEQVMKLYERKIASCSWMLL